MYHKKRFVLWSISFLVGILLLVFFFSSVFPSLEEDQTIPKHPKTVTIASWNLQVFGKTKAENTALLDDYAAFLRAYDIVFLQEIRDGSGNAFQQLCDRLAEYTCAVSSRAGRSSSKEQYGLLYRTNATLAGESLQLLASHDFSPDARDRWERPPTAVTFSVDTYVFTLYTIHIKPTDVHQELRALEALVVDEGNSAILGDLNADCSYYRRSKNSAFADWRWIIKDGDDTTLGKSNCAYDRILLNDDAFREFMVRGIRSEGITPEHSDHRLIWFSLATEEQ